MALILVARDLCLTNQTLDHHKGESLQPGFWDCLGKGW